MSQHPPFQTADGHSISNVEQAQLYLNRLESIASEGWTPRQLQDYIRLSRALLNIAAVEERIQLEQTRRGLPCPSSLAQCVHDPSILEGPSEPDLTFQPVVTWSDGELEACLTYTYDGWNAGNNVGKWRDNTNNWDGILAVPSIPIVQVPQGTNLRGRDLRETPLYFVNIAGADLREAILGTCCGVKFGFPENAQNVLSKPSPTQLDGVRFEGDVCYTIFSSCLAKGLVLGSTLFWANNFCRADLNIQSAENTRFGYCYEVGYYPYTSPPIKIEEGRAQVIADPDCKKPDMQDLGLSSTLVFGRFASGLPFPPSSKPLNVQASEGVDIQTTNHGLADLHEKGMRIFEDARRSALSDIFMVSRALGIVIGQQNQAPQSLSVAPGIEPAAQGGQACKKAGQEK